ncbi:MAG TPA: hypothetical protein VE973_04335 [Candidatus Limnocylindria bacterium]|nr:hypothetical protein [Candidatus Limnocylindria bacterium]
MRKFLAGFYITVILVVPVLAKADFSRTYENLYNPLPSGELFCPTVACDLTQLFLLLIRDILQLVPIVSVLFIIIGGFQMVSSAGNEERLVKAKKTILWAVMGLVFALLSFSIIAIVKNLLGAA